MGCADPPPTPLLLWGVGAPPSVFLETTQKNEAGESSKRLRERERERERERKEIDWTHLNLPAPPVTLVIGMIAATFSW